MRGLQRNANGDPGRLAPGTRLVLERDVQKLKECMSRLQSKLFLRHGVALRSTVWFRAGRATPREQRRLK
jgi:hypothetical protein